MRRYDAARWKPLEYKALENADVRNFPRCKICPFIVSNFLVLLHNQCGMCIGSTLKATSSTVQHKQSCDEEIAGMDIGVQRMFQCRIPLSKDVRVTRDEVLNDLGLDTQLPWAATNVVHMHIRAMLVTFALRQNTGSAPMPLTTCMVLQYSEELPLENSVGILL